MPNEQKDPVIAEEMKQAREQTQARIDKGEYEGETNDEGKRHGKGKCVWQDKSEYDGNWDEDVREGLGVFKYENGDIYRGQWHDD